MIHCIIVDDEEHAIEVIQHYLKPVSAIHILATFTHPIDALSFLSRNPVDLIFLDIHMPEISGIEFIQSIQHQDIQVILTTAYKEFATNGFDLNVVDYLVKPIPLPRFLQAINKAQNLINSKNNNGSMIDRHQDDYFMVKTEAKGKMLKINIAEIDFVEGMKNYVAFHHNGIRTLALLTMKDVEDRLPKTQFIRVQKSFIVALNKITSIDGNRIILKGISAEILIGETYRKDFLDMMKQKLLL
ncbi:LytR/AlgR family response regulator transcription factor [Pedobacter sp. GR22-10]|jgi:DNA-binding LytR/AlgR family response regulator|uniref:LytR/AlgR family response regulator transcription factor n=1 Tax=Pedobacter sp. GR22-10 TaxID=2994472 RepID=UPI00224803CB|nr:LytTR family DNA-binding domain-containing protein [Pedobacter sp. GR22-10]MCX2432663.1 LytTR family DNA-binding domain-containing protein [Pedobacter sp. GR22-10]